MSRICIVAHFALGAMKGGADGHSGGVERQTSIMARWLARRGHDVSLVTWDEGQEDGLVIDGVRMLKVCRRDEGLPGLRFFHPRWTSLNLALRRADAQLYYQNCAEYVTGQVAWWCRRHGRYFVYSVASDPECDPRLPEMRTFRERILYRYGLKRAARIIVQTRKQKRLLKEGFGLEAIFLPMPCPGPVEAEFKPTPESSPGTFRVGWVGRIAPVKRLEVLLAAAERLPDVQFEVAGKPDAAESYTRPVLEKARAMGNVNLHGHVDRDRMPGFYRAASVLCCTSDYEGFPNTFLEAWSHGLPIVSTVDPDNLISERGLGVCAANPQEMVQAIFRLREDPALRRSISANARNYYLENHAVDPAMRRFEDVFADELRERERMDP
jgi:glycosyltransferase involved in cell wall biosynthesis